MTAVTVCAFFFIFLSPFLACIFCLCCLFKAANNVVFPDCSAFPFLDFNIADDLPVFEIGVALHISRY